MLYAKLLKVKNANFGENTEIVCLAGSLCVCLAHQGSNPQKSYLRDLVCKKDRNGKPVQPCGPITMSNHDAGNLLMQSTWYFLPLAAWATAYRVLPDLFDEHARALLKMLYSSMCANMDEARALFARLKKNWTCPMIDFENLWTFVSMTDSDFRLELALSKVQAFVGVMIPKFRILLYQALVRTGSAVPPPGCSGLDMPWAVAVTAEDLTFASVEGNFAHRREMDCVVVLPGKLRDNLVAKGFSCSSPKKRPIVDGNDETEHDVNIGGGSGSGANHVPNTGMKARRGAGGGHLGAEMRAAAGELRANGMPQFVNPEVSNFDEDCHQKREKSKQEPELKLDDKPIAEPDFILISSTEASPVKEAKGKATEASPVKEAKGKAKQAYVAIELSSTEASPIKSEVKLSERMADVLQQYLLVTQGNDLGVAVAALDKHGSLDAALEAFFGEAPSTAILKAEPKTHNVDPKELNHLDRLLQAAANGSVGSGTLGNTASSYAIESSAIFGMKSKDDVVKTVQMERDMIANNLYDEKYGEKNDGMYIRAQAEAKVHKSSEDKSKRERSKMGLDKLLGVASVPAALKDYHGKNGVTEKGNKKKMNGITEEGLAGDPSANDFPEEDRKAYIDAVSNTLVKDGVVQIGESLGKGKRAYKIDGSNTMILLGTKGMSYYDEKYLDMNHFFKSGTHNEAGHMQSGWIQKALFLRSGGSKAKAICDEWDNEHYSGYHPEQAKSLRENYKNSALLCFEEHLCEHCVRQIKRTRSG